jgi:hypothetical protein
MNPKHISIVLILTVLIAGLCLTGPSLAGGKAGASSTQETIEGVLAIKEGHGHILVRPETGNDIALRMNESTKITRNGKPAEYADLQGGDKIRAKYDSTNREAVEIHAKGS